MSPDAPRIVLDVSFEIRIHHQSHVWRQAQYLVKLADESCCSAHCTGRFICDADQSCDSFFVSGAVFGELGGLVLLPGALYWTFHVSLSNTV